MKKYKEDEGNDIKCKYCGEYSSAIYDIIGELGLVSGDKDNPPTKLNTAFCCQKCYTKIWKVIRITLKTFKAIANLKVRKIK